MVMLSPAIMGGIWRLLFWTMIKFNSSKNHPKTAPELNSKLIVISEEIFIWIYISIAIVISKISIAITIVSEFPLLLPELPLLFPLLFPLLELLLESLLESLELSVVTSLKSLFTKSYCNGLFLVCSALICSLKCDFYFCISFFSASFLLSGHCRYVVTLKLGNDIACRDSCFFCW